MNVGAVNCRVARDMLFSLLKLRKRYLNNDVIGLICNMVSETWQSPVWKCQHLIWRSSPRYEDGKWITPRLSGVREILIKASSLGQCESDKIKCCESCNYERLWKMNGSRYSQPKNCTCKRRPCLQDCCSPKPGAYGYRRLHWICKICNDDERDCTCKKYPCQQEIWEDRDCARCCGKPSWITTEDFQEMDNEHDYDPSVWRIAEKFCRDHVGFCRRHGPYNPNNPYGGCDTCYAFKQLQKLCE